MGVDEGTVSRGGKADGSDIVSRANVRRFVGERRNESEGRIIVVFGNFLFEIRSPIHVFK